MVRLSIMETTGPAFIYEAPVTAQVEEVVRACTRIHNLRGLVMRLVGNIQQLIQYGPSRHPDIQGLTLEQAQELKKAPPDMTENDPLARRIGKPCDERVVPTLEKMCAEAMAVVSKELAVNRKLMSMDAIEEAIQNVKGAVMMAYPMGLPEWDPVRNALEDDEDLAGQDASKSVLDVETSLMWFAGKQMAGDQPLSKYVGRNDKCMVKVKLTKKGSQAPQREAGVDEETKKKMMAYWHKKQEVNKALAEEDEDSYMNSSWANPKGFKSNIHGTGGAVRWRAGMQ